MDRRSATPASSDLSVHDSWGRLDRRPRPAIPAAELATDAAKAIETPPGAFLPFGNGRSYGDSCHNDAGTLLDSRGESEILSFDPERGLLTARAGTPLWAITRHVAPAGWFLPVTPGTQFVTLGGAIANDVHGKNHHRRGTFGRWVEALTLWRSDRGLLECTPDREPDLFAATIAGMGLTGLIRQATIRLVRVPSLTIRTLTRRFEDLSGFFAMAEEADRAHEYVVAWIDSLAKGRKLGRGHLIAGDHAEGGERSGLAGRSLGTVPVTPPISPLNRLTLGAFNAALHHRQPKGGREGSAAFDRFFYPLDRVTGWNRLYGPRGLHQHQSVVPLADAEAVVASLIECSQRHGQGSFLTVLKRFGDTASPGIMSFPRPGYTLTLDFPHRGRPTLDLLAELDAITIGAGGAVNPYKDARMSPATFEAGFPRWRQLDAMRDPALMSDFWRRTAMRLV